MVDEAPADPTLEEIVLRLTDLFKAGPPKEEKSLLLTKYGTLENRPIINAPKLNLEAEAFSQKPVTSRDSWLEDNQDKGTVCLAVLRSKVFELLKGQKVDDITLLERLNNMGRLLVDQQRNEALKEKCRFYLTFMCRLKKLSIPLSLTNGSSESNWRKI